MNGKRLFEFISVLIILAFMGGVLWQSSLNVFTATSVTQDELPPITEIKDNEGLPIVPEPKEPEEAQVEPGDTLPPDDTVVACTMDAKQCPDGSFVGRVGPDCEFAACPETAVVPPGGPISPEYPEVTDCDPDNRPEVCYDLYAPVCGLVEVQCITTPCNPVPETFSNDCNACAQSNVISYTEGACKG